VCPHLAYPCFVWTAYAELSSIRTSVVLLVALHGGSIQANDWIAWLEGTFSEACARGVNALFGFQGLQALTSRHVFVDRIAFEEPHSRDTVGDAWRAGVCSRAHAAGSCTAVAMRLTLPGTIVGAVAPTPSRDVAAAFIALQPSRLEAVIGGSIWKVCVVPSSGDVRHSERLTCGACGGGTLWCVRVVCALPRHITGCGRARGCQHVSLHDGATARSG